MAWRRGWRGQTARACGTGRTDSTRRATKRGERRAGRPTSRAPPADRALRAARAGGQHERAARTGNERARHWTEQCEQAGGRCERAVRAAGPAGRRGRRHGAADERGGRRVEGSLLNRAARAGERRGQPCVPRAPSVRARPRRQLAWPACPRCTCAPSVRRCAPVLSCRSVQWRAPGCCSCAPLACIARSRCPTQPSAVCAEVSRRPRLRTRPPGLRRHLSCLRAAWGGAARWCIGRLVLWLTGWVVGAGFWRSGSGASRRRRVRRSRRRRAGRAWR